ncbi:MAG: endo-1,4-beta-xylanase [Paludibacteraceae bacterium]|nr:endo-1,4-beta-xylanase [Paludibacteraceae bacterium]
MKKYYMKAVLAAVGIMMANCAMAQLAKDNPCKFLGNITTTKDWNTGEQCDYSDCNLVYADYWNQITCENATKWGSVHNGWGRFNWSSPDRTYKYCQEHGIIFKFHALIWGSQHPNWIESLSVDDTKKAIVEWYDECKKHFPNLEIIDVVNEAIYSGGDYHSPYKSTKIIQALGSLAEDRAQKETGTRPSYNCNTNGYPNTNSYQWIAEAFRLARDRWPNAILIYNDYNTFQWQKTEFINLINGLKACGAPIDAAGNQAHDLNDMSGSQFRSALEEIHNKTQIPQYITEYDIAKSDDATFETRYKEQFPIMWEADYVAGVTLWGWIYGHTWVTNGCSGLVRDCKKRSAFTWLENYMKTDAAKNAQSPFCGTASKLKANVELSANAISVGDKLTINVEASTTEGSISNITVKVDGNTVNDENGKWVYVADKAGDLEILVTVQSTNGDSKEIKKSITVCDARAPFSGSASQIPGTIEAEDFDKGCNGVASYDSDDTDEGDSKGYRFDNGGVDIVKGNGGYAIGYTKSDEWLEYTVNIEQAGTYTVSATVSSGSSNSGFKISCGNSSAKISVPAGEDWDTYTDVNTEMDLYDEGEQTIRFTITGDYVNIDKVKFTCQNCSTSGIEITPSEMETGNYTVISMIGETLGEVTYDGGDLNEKVKQITGNKGVYILKNTNSGKASKFICK